MRKILLICTGNICRSSMAQVLLGDALTRRQKENDYLLDSAGLAALSGVNASEQAQAALHEMGLDLSYHKAKQVTDEMLQDADLILTMTASHKKVILEVMPSMKGKVFTLKEWVGNEMEDLDVLDPFGQSLAVYCRCRDELKELLEKTADKLEEVEKHENSHCE